MRENGHEVIGLSRSKDATRDNLVHWDPAKGELNPAALAGIDAFVNLAGENLAERWSEEKKKQFRESRIPVTALISRTIAALPQKPAVLVSTSAIGVYGHDRGDEELDEHSPLGDDFLATLCKDWEAATAPANEAGIRVVHARSGIVLNPAGGVIEKLLVPFRLGIGGKVGSGNQWVSWIARTDHVRAILFLIEKSVLHGPVNMTAPHPATNEQLATELGKAIHRPAVAPVPATVIRMMLGREMADSTVLATQQVLPRRLIGAGFEFRFPALPEALEHELKKGATKK